jgi:hypothetical protein
MWSLDLGQIGGIRIQWNVILYTRIVSVPFVSGSSIYARGYWDKLMASLASLS